MFGNPHTSFAYSTIRRNTRQSAVATYGLESDGQRLRHYLIYPTHAPGCGLNPFGMADVIALKISGEDAPKCNAIIGLISSPESI